ncbi:hypothetical protein [Collinsella sp. AM28-11LB]|uniref:DUF6932 family protein n=1 Tax=Collinsella sp. AM28-11LB TaxID=2292312 RepID=UPI000E4D9023|nr:hypothetical protein [Collinsella sp. AM28-11LB]RHE52654.1 hypothetical protein DW732_02150 [Collinsella sp. AM28-11LB]
MIPELVDIGAKRRVLPLGRYSCSFDDIRERYVPDDDENRSAIWEGLLTVVNLVRGTVGSIAELWIGGSFITSEENPHDIDVVFFFKEECIKSVDNRGAFLLNLLSGRYGHDRRLNSYVDSYMMVVPPTEFENDASRGYTPWRGYWDQFWSKTRFEDDDKRWLYPAAGYLEVMIDGYDD